MKRCSKCGKDKPTLAFYSCKGGKFGVRSWCKECDKESTRKWREDHPDKSREMARAWVEQNEIPERQGGGCAICGIPLNERTLNVDHVHKGGVRGILCPKCNKGLGLFQDNPGRLTAAIEYLVGSVQGG